MTMKTKVKNLRKDAEVIGRDLVNVGQSRVRKVTTAALDAAEKVLGTAQHRVRKLRTKVAKPKA